MTNHENHTMKKLIVCLLALGTAFSWACSRIEQDTLAPENAPEGVEITVRATLADSPQTRTVLAPDRSVLWTPGDAINLFYGDRSSGKFSADITEPKALTNFTGTLTAATGSAEVGLGARNFWGVYPYDENTTCDGSSVTITLPARQAALPDTFADKFNPSVALSPGLDLAFYNVCAPFYFSVTQEKVTSATLKGNKNEILAGKVRVTMDAEGHPVANVIEGSKSVTVNAPAGEFFIPGTTYVVLLLPQTMTAGYTLSLKKGTAQADCVVSKSADFVRSKGREKLEADKGLEYVSTQPKNVLYYTSTDGQIVTPNTTVNIDANVVSNEYVDGQGILTFDGPITKIGGYTFENCSTLATIDIPDGVTSLGDYCFSNCTGLTNIAFSESVTNIGYGAFGKCTNLTGIILPDALAYLGNYAFDGCTGFTSITIPESVTIIRSGTFNNCSNLAKAILPSGITTIGSSAFANCSKLSTFEFPTSVKTLETSAFMGCASLSSVTLSQSLTSIGGQAFMNCKSLVTVTIPNSVTSLGSAAFSGCSSLKSFSGKFASSDGLFLINSGAIAGVALASLTGDITIPSEVRVIAESSFQNCKTITGVTIPAGVTGIGRLAFSGCSGLKTITVLPTTPPTLGTSAFSSTASAPIYVPSASLTTYKAADGWKGYASRIYAIQ